MLRKFSFVLALLLLAHRSALAQTTLEFSYADPIFINVVHTSEADVSLMGQNTKIEMKASFLFKVDTGETEKGVTTCNVTILDCDDTTSANGKSSGKDMLKGLKNQKFEVVISENNQKIELRKTEAARRIIESSGRDIRLEVDGGIKVDNIRAVADAGADTFVAGSAIFGQPDYKAVIDAMRTELAKCVRSAHRSPNKRGTSRWPSGPKSKLLRSSAPASASPT